MDTAVDEQAVHCSTEVAVVVPAVAADMAVVERQVVYTVDTEPVVADNTGVAVDIVQEVAVDTAAAGKAAFAQEVV